MIDRSEVNRALAKALAYKACGKDAEAADWAAQVVCLLECSGILNSRAVCRAIDQGARGVKWNA